MKPRVKILLLAALFVLFTHMPAAAGGWRVMKTVRFEIYYPEDAEELALSAAREAEKAYVRVSRYLGHELTRVLPVIVRTKESVIESRFSKKKYHSFLKYSIDFYAEDARRGKELRRQMTYAFQYNILFDDESGNSMNANNCGLVDEWFLKGMAEYIAEGEGALFRALESGRPGIAGEILKDARDKKLSIENSFLINTGKSFKELLETEKIEEIETEETEKTDELQNRAPTESGPNIFDFRESVFKPYSAYPSKQLMGGGFYIMPYNTASAYVNNSVSDELETFSFTQTAGLVKLGDDLHPELSAAIDYTGFTPVLSAGLYMRNRYSSGRPFPAAGTVSGTSCGGELEAALPLSASIKAFAGAGIFSAGSAFVESGAGLRCGIVTERQQTEARAFVSGTKGNGGSWTRAEFNFTSRLSAGKNFGLALSGFYGKIFGGDGVLAYYIGGLGRLRARAVAGAQTAEAVLLNPALGFVIFDRSLGRLPLSILKIELTAFTDLSYMREPSALGGRGLYADAGAGFRFVFYPLTILKLDFARPLGKTSSCGFRVNFGLELSL
ncbi:MAG: hypothetical protein LBT84_03325 [Spirochaetia bacterium]|jgi:hypothetical protein|nr:hypothetical protein [Spirochaetia bacterium]